MVFAGSIEDTSRIGWKCSKHIETDDCFGRACIFKVLVFQWPFFGCWGGMEKKNSTSQKNQFYRL